MRVAIIHPWFLIGGGAEQVVDALAGMYPSADIFTLFYDERHLPPNVKGRRIQALSLNWIPAKYSLYRPLMAFYPLMFESLDLRGYDMVISSDSCVAKGIIVDQNAVHICYCHSPMRCLWDLHREYRSAFPPVARPFFTLASHYVRQWDLNAAARVDEFVANSRNVAQRISKFYRRPSKVIYPPVNTDQGYISQSIGDYYFSVGRLADVKKLDILIHACNQIKRRLIIAGTGRNMNILKRLAGPTIEFAGWVSESELSGLYANCRAFLFVADEDFGIVPVEAQSYGRPVIAYGHGGSLETVIPTGDSSDREPTGILFPSQSVDSLKAAILSFEQSESAFIPQAIRRNAQRFDRSIFSLELTNFVEQVYRRERNLETDDLHFSEIELTQSPAEKVPREKILAHAQPGI
jgi:glycosyltransferase involved in cell wall biosynthesis